MATQTLKIPVLSASATEAFDRYKSAAEKKRTADATGRKQKEIKDENAETIMTEMGESMLAQLPDGRVIRREKKEQQRSAQKASTVSWWEIGEVGEVA